MKRNLLLRLIVKSDWEDVFKRRLPNCLSTCSVQLELDLVVVNMPIYLWYYRNYCVQRKESELHNLATDIMTSIMIVYHFLIVPIMSF